MDVFIHLCVNVFTYMHTHVHTLNSSRVDQIYQHAILFEFDCFRKCRGDRRIYINGYSWQDCSAVRPVKVFLPRLKTRLVSHRFLYSNILFFFLPLFFPTQRTQISDRSVGYVKERIS